mgnify:FL=1
MEQKREFTGVWIPKEVLLDDDLSSDEKILFSDIACFENCFILNRTFAERYKCSERTIQTRLKKLKDKGYLIEKSFDGRERILQVLHIFSYQTRSMLRGRHEETFTPDMKKPSPLLLDNSIDNKEMSAKPKTFSNFRDQRRIETGRLPMLRAKKTIKSKKAWDELSEVDYEFKRYRGRAESKTGEDYSLLDDSLNPQMKRLMALAISKVNKKGKVMDDFYEYLFERSEYARKQKYNPLVCLTDRMLVDWQMESIKVKETLEDAALRIAKEERLRWPDDSDQARMSAANRFGEVSGILTTDPEWWEKIKPYRKLLGY